MSQWIRALTLFFGLGFSLSAAGLRSKTMSSPSNGFVAQVQNALANQDLQEVENLFSHPPKGQPLIAADGRMIFSLYQIYLYQNDLNLSSRILALSRQAIVLGANVHRHLLISKEDTNEIKYSQKTAVEAILETWAVLAQQQPLVKEAIASRSSTFLDLLFEAGQLRPDGYVKAFYPDGPKEFTYLEYSFIFGATTDIYRYFLKKRPPLEALNEIGWNAPTTMAIAANVQALNDLVVEYGDEGAAESLNFRNPDSGRTVMHMAIISILDGASVEQAYGVIEFLANHGVDPDRKSLHATLLQEADYQASRRTEYRDQFRELRKKLAERLPELREMYVSAKIKLCRIPWEK